MFSWIVDHANVLYFLLGAATLALLAAGWTTRRPVYWAYAGVGVALIGLLWLLSIFVVTDRRQIANAIDAMCRGTEAQNPEAIFKHVSKSFRAKDRDREETFQRISAAVKIHHVTSIAISAREVKIEGDTAEVFFNFRADTQDTTAGAASAKAVFVREEGAWKLRDLELYRLGTTERLFVPGWD